ncbi:MAG: hypothetical protein ACLFQK_03420 [Fibrobacterota bacterium]
MKEVHDYYHKGFEEAEKKNLQHGRRIGSELKMPLVSENGEAVDIGIIDKLWEYLGDNGWEKITDAHSGKVTGARKMGEHNHTLASCETGYCKTEFSLSHVGDLFELKEAVEELRAELGPFAKKHNVHFLAYGIHPVTKPGKHLLMKSKGRSQVWNKTFGANRILHEDDGDDVNIFTVNAASHVHISVSKEEAVRSVNILNGFSGAQIALTAHSNIWKREIDPDHKCVSEMFWDWWIPDGKRIGVPEKEFSDLEDYVSTINDFKPVFVKRDGKPVILDYESFRDYFARDKAEGEYPDGTKIDLVPHESDIDLHSTCYWFNTRITRYYTVENRANDQQPPKEMPVIAALTLGLISAPEKSLSVLRQYKWEDLRELRSEACKKGMAAESGDVKAHRLAEEMLECAREGLVSREKGEEIFLKPLFERLIKKENPADEIENIFKKGGVKALIDSRTFC